VLTQRPPELGDRLSFGDNLLSFALSRLLVGRQEIAASPLILGAWFGMLVTMLNLMPIGQLDGGHLTHAWFGPRAIGLGKVIAAAMAFLALFYSVGWVVWLLLTTRVVGFRHPEVAQPVEPLSRGRKLVCALCFVCFALTLMPVPMTAV
jgi:membrane-associated protease RseP (regulator of RpoE activity)